MAIVQRLVRVPAETLEACRTDENTLDQAISFELRPSEDYLDLDWSPSGLALYFEKSGQRPEVQTALKLATKGARIVNPACTDSELDYDVVNQVPVYSHITELTPDEVADVATKFHMIDIKAFLAWLPKDINQAREVLGKDSQAVPIGWHPNQYFESCLKDLIDFYRVASARHFATIMWWD